MDPIEGEKKFQPRLQPEGSCFALKSFTDGHLRFECAINKALLETGNKIAVYYRFGNEEVERKTYASVVRGSKLYEKLLEQQCNDLAEESIRMQSILAEHVASLLEVKETAEKSFGKTGFLESQIIDGKHTVVVKEKRQDPINKEMEPVIRKRDAQKDKGAPRNIESYLNHLNAGEKIKDSKTSQKSQRIADKALKRYQEQLLVEKRMSLKRRLSLAEESSEPSKRMCIEEAALSESTEALSENSEIKGLLDSEPEECAFRTIYDEREAFVAPSREIDKEARAIEFSKRNQKGVFEGLEEIDFKKLAPSDNLFGHIHLGALAKASRYAGLSEIDAMEFLQKVYQELQRNGKPKLKENLERIAADYIEIAKIINRIGYDHETDNLDLIKNKEDCARKIKELVQNVFQKIKDLKDGQTLLLPSGFSGHPGHTMQLEITKTGDSYCLNLYNTGEGLRWHAKLGEKHLLKRGFEDLKKEDILDEELFFALFQLQIIGYNKSCPVEIKADHPYLAVESALMGKEHVKRLKIKQDTPFQAAQKAGLCSWTSLKAWLANKEQARLIRYLSLRSFFENNRENLVGEKGLLLKKAAERFLDKEIKHFKKAAQKGKIHPSLKEDLDAAKALCEKIQKAVEEAQESECKKASEAFFYSEDKTLPKALKDFQEKHVFAAMTHQAQSTLIDKKVVPILEHQGPKKLEDVVSWLEEQTKKCFEHFSNPNIDSRYKQEFLKGMLDALPLPSDDFWKSEAKIEWQKISKSLLTVLYILKKLQSGRFEKQPEITLKIYTDQILATMDLATKNCWIEKDGEKKQLKNLLEGFSVLPCIAASAELAKKDALQAEDMKKVRGFHTEQAPLSTSPELQKKWASLKSYFDAKASLFGENGLKTIYENCLDFKDPLNQESSALKNQLPDPEKYSLENIQACFLWGRGLGLENHPLNELRNAYLLANSSVESEIIGFNLETSINLQCNVKPLLIAGILEKIQGQEKCFSFTDRGCTFNMSTSGEKTLLHDTERNSIPQTITSFKDRSPFQALSSRCEENIYGYHAMDIAAIVNKLSLDSARLQEPKWQYFLMDALSKKLLRQEEGDKALLNSVKGFLEKSLEKLLTEEKIPVQAFVFFMRLKSTLLEHLEDAAASLDKSAQQVDQLLEFSKKEKRGLEKKMLACIYACRLDLHLRHADHFFETRQKELFQDLLHTQGGDIIALERKSATTEEEKRDEMILKAFDESLQEELVHSIYQKRAKLKEQFNQKAFNAFLKEENITEQEITKAPDDALFIECTNGVEGFSFKGNLLRGIYQFNNANTAKPSDALKKSPLLEELGLELKETCLEHAKGFETSFKDILIDSSRAVKRSWKGSDYRYIANKEKAFDSWLFQYEAWQGADGFIFCDPKNHKPLYKASKDGTITELDLAGNVVKTVISTQESFKEPWKDVFANWRPALLWQDEEEKKTLTLPSQVDEEGKALCFLVQERDGKVCLFLEKDPQFELKSHPPTTWKAPGMTGPLFLESLQEKRILIPGGNLQEEDPEKRSGLIKTAHLKTAENPPSCFKCFTMEEGGQLKAKGADDWLHIAQYALVTKDYETLKDAFLHLHQFDSFEDEAAVQKQISAVLKQWMELSYDPNEQIIALLAYHSVFVRCRKTEKDAAKALVEDALKKLFQRFPQEEHLEKYELEKILQLLPKGGLEQVKEDLSIFLGLRFTDNDLSGSGHLPQITFTSKNVETALINIQNFLEQADLELTDEEKAPFEDWGYPTKVEGRSLTKVCLKIKEDLASADQEKQKKALRAKRRIIAEVYQAEKPEAITQVACLLLLEKPVLEQKLRYRKTDAIINQSIIDTLNSEFPKFLEQIKLPSRPKEEPKTPFGYAKDYLHPSQEPQLSNKSDALRGTIQRGNFPEELLEELRDLETSIIERLNKNPFIQESAEHTRWAAEKAAGQIAERELADAYAMFMHPGGFVTQKHPLYLSQQEALLLEAQIVRYLQVKHKIAFPDATRNYQLQFEESGHLPQAQKVMLFFEVQAAISLRERQVALIKELLETKDAKSFMPQVQELMMGEGKSKVLLPILAQAIADGKTVPFLMVPPALYASNLEDLQKLSVKMFKQAFRTFSCSRETLKGPLGTERLKRFLEDLELAVEERSCFFITPATLHALYLSYHEEIANFPYFEDPENLKVYLNNQSKFRHLRGILNLLKTNAHFLIDEIDTVLRCTDETHYTLDAPKNLNFTLFQKACKFNYAAIELAKELNIKSKDDYETHKEDFIELALKHFGLEENEEIKAFLKGAGIEVIKEALSEEQRELLAFFKASIRDFLPVCLSRQHNVNYGLSLQEQPRLYAIPYLSNNQPNESADFAQSFETLLYTELCYTKAPPPLKHLQSWLKSLKKESSEEARERNIFPATTKNAVRFSEATNLDLLELDEEKETDLKQLQEKFEKGQNRRDLLYFYLEHAVFPQIKNYPKKLSSYGVSLVELAKSVQGFTGTLWNGKSYHETLSQNLHQQVEPIEELKEALKSPEKTLKVSCITQKDPKAFIKQALKDGLQTKRAVIDIGAQFAGVDNETVVRGFAEHFKEEHLPIKGILYYDRENCLNVYNVESGHRRALIGTDIGQLKDQYKKEELFTYYDQAHTTGSDIQQIDNATAIVCVGHNTLDRDLCQGVMRMRQLRKGNQSLEFVLSETLAKKIVLEGEASDIKTQVEKILKHCEEIEQERRERENFHALRQKIRNCCQRVVEEELFLKFRGEALATYQALHNPDLRQFFVQDCDDSLLKKYAQKIQERKTKELIEEFIEEWREKCLDALRALEVGEKNLKSVEQYINYQGYLLYKDMEEHLPTKVQSIESPSETAERQELQQEEQMAEKEQQKELQMLIELKDKCLKTSPAKKDARSHETDFWKKCLRGEQKAETLSFLFCKIIRKRDEESFNNLLKPERFFSDNLYLTRACGWRKEGADSYEPILFSAYAREIPYFAWIQEDKKVPKLVLLDHQDGTELWDALQGVKDPKTKISLCASDGTLLKGPEAPEDKENLFLQALILRADIQNLWGNMSAFIDMISKKLSDTEALELLQNLLRRALIFYPPSQVHSFFQTLCSDLKRHDPSKRDSSNLERILKI